MPAFFAHNRGTVVRITSQHLQAGGVLPFRVILQGTNIETPAVRAIITQAGVVEQGNYQFQHTLNETIYAYVFGDRIGELRVSGMCFTIPCDDGFGSEDGIKQISDIYRTHRIANAGAPIGVNFGSVDYQGFLVGLNLEIADAEHNIGQWAFRLNTFPGHRQ